MALSGKTAAPIEIPYYLGTDKPPSLAEGTKTPAERVHALLEDLGAKEVLNGTAIAGELLIAQPGDVARFKAMKGDGTIDKEGNFQLGAGVVGSAELGKEVVSLEKLAKALELPESYLAAAVQAKLNNERVPLDGSVTSRKFKPTAGLVKGKENLSLTGAFVEVPGASVEITAAVASILQVNLVARRRTGAGPITATLKINEVVENGRVAMVGESTGAWVEASGSQTYSLALPAGTYTIAMVAERPSLTAAELYGKESGFSYLLLAS